jgi:pyridoxal phosphate enzyme (YggS family)
MSSVVERLAAVRNAIAEAREAAGRTDRVMLVAVSKTMPPGALLEAYGAGQRVFGENRVQEAIAKQDELSGQMADVQWHMIGHLQTNKVKQVVGRFALVQSVDSLKLASALDRHADLAGIRQPVLFEINVAGEASKSGFSEEAFLETMGALMRLKYLDPRGLMTIAPAVDDASEVRPVFRRLRALRDRFRDESALPAFQELSMGMTNDFKEAIAEGATIVRLGRAIFGDRPAP